LSEIEQSAAELKRFDNTPPGTHNTPLPNLSEIKQSTVGNCDKKAENLEPTPMVGAQISITARTLQTYATACKILAKSSNLRLSYNDVKI